MNISLETLAPRPLWVAWQSERREPGKPPTKVPYSPTQNSKARADLPATWGTRQEAEARAARLPQPLGSGGIGLELADLGDGRRIGGVDLDTCANAAGIIEPWARDVIHRLASYTEVSPSGSGCKVFFLYDDADLHRLREAMGTDHGKAWKRGTGEHPPAIELHLGHRYFTLTGKHLDGTPVELVPVNTDNLLWLIFHAGPAFAGRSHQEPPRKAVEGPGNTSDLAARIEAEAARWPALARRWAGNWEGLQDQSRSARAFALGGILKRAGFSRTDMAEALRLHDDTRDWAGTASQRDLARIFDNSGEDRPAADPELLANPDMSMLRSTRPPPALPLEVFGDTWANWITQAAKAKACRADYVVAPLLAAASALIGNARWPAAPAWSEPPHLWMGVVGDSGGGKSPGADAVLGDVIPELERRMGTAFPDQLRDWKAEAAAYEAATERWKDDVKKAGKTGHPAPLPPAGEPPAEPQCPCLRLNDVTIEKVAMLLATSAGKGLLIVRDELAGWIAGMDAYRDGGRAFWLEAYGGRHYRLARVKHPQPIDIPHLAVAMTGGTQPAKLAELMQEADDGLMARVNWIWPDSLPFKLGMVPPNSGWAIDALDRLRALDLAQPSSPGKTPSPVLIPLANAALADLEAFGQDMQDKQQDAAGLMRSTYGKARGTALRLSLVLQYLWWCAGNKTQPPPTEISHAAFKAAAHFVGDYLMPMALRVYGDAAVSDADRNAATLARWIIKKRPAEVHVRTLQRETRLANLKDAGSIHAACKALVEAGWLSPPMPGAKSARAKEAYPVNPRVHEVAP